MIWLIPGARQIQNTTQWNSGFQRLASLLDPGNEGKRKMATAEKRKSMDEAFLKADLRSGFKHWFELFWYSQLPCFDIKGLHHKKRMTCQ